jgi:glycosyltransferase involved in cell wall biosynthesis
MIKPFFSVIIPTYNRVQFAERAVESVLKQEYQDFEVLLIDDGSTEDYSKLIEKYQLNKKVIYHKQKNGHLSAARNKGINLAKGQWICFLDDDDYYLSNHLSALNACIIKNNGLSGLYRTFTFFEDENGIRTKQSLTEFSGNRGEYILKSLLTVNNVCMPREIFLREKFDEELRIAEDYNMWLRVLVKNQLFESAVFTTVYYRSGLTMSTYNFESTLKYLKSYPKTFSITEVKNFLNYKVRKQIIIKYITWYFDTLIKEKQVISYKLIFYIFFKYPSFIMFKGIIKYYCK